MDEKATLPDPPRVIAPGERRRAHDAELIRGMVVGRYIVLSRLGAGGMGVVYVAYDPELDRKIALKLLRPGGARKEARTRLLREAQALAKLQHPNVVTIYDVGTFQQRVWLAMELVEGQTLGQWRKAKARAWPEALEVLIGAGRGVAAAHQAELLHRDLKPENIMVGDDGRVRVMDFGLARHDQARQGASAPDLAAPALDAPPGPDPKALATPSLEALAIRVTHSDALLGTPAYMAPEQFHGGEISAATDQFSFCVTLWETLWGARPFSGDNVTDIAAAVLDKPGSPPAEANVPGWLRRVIERGLSVEPAARWPSLDDLLHVLRRGRTRAWWRRGLAVLGALGLTAAAVAGWRQLDHDERVAACERAGESIHEVWSAETRDDLRAALVATGVTYAAETADKVMPWLDAQAQAWQTARTDVCLAADIHESWSADLRDRGLRCLDERRMELEALVLELSRGGAGAVERAVQAATALTPVARCQDGDLLSQLPNPPDPRRDDVRAVRVELAKATALERTGAYTTGLAVAGVALDRAEALAWPPLVAEVRLQIGSLLDHSGDYPRAADALEAAYFSAARSGASEVVAIAASKLVHTVGNQLERHDQGLLWSRLAEVALASLPDPEGIRTTIQLNNLAILRELTGEYEEARKLYERALAVREQALGPEHPQVATVLNNLAGLHRTTGSYDDAKALHERALAIKERALGSDHPQVSRSLNNLANVHLDTGGYAEAAALYRRALAVTEKAFGPDHRQVASVLSNLGGTYLATGARKEAKTLFERALAIEERALGPDHPKVARSLTNLAECYRAIGAASEAKALLERALAIRRKALGSRHPDVAASLNSLAGVHLDTGAHDEADELYRQALAIRETALGAEHALVAFPVLGLAQVALARRAPRDAVPLAERAVKLRADAGAPATQLAEARFVLARSLWQAGRDHPRAIALAREALDGYRETEAARESEIAEVERWLAITTDRIR